MDIPDSGTFVPAILYAEDDRVTRDVVTLLLHNKFPDVTVYQAENGQQGLELFKTHGPDIVLTDMRMPIMDGIRMAKEIKKLNKDTRIIVATADTDTNRILETIDIGIDHYVLKPINQAKLFSVIELCINSIHLEKQLRKQGDFIRKLSHAVEQSPVSIIITDTSGKIEYVNPGFTRLTGYTPAEAVGEKPGILKSEEIPPEEYNTLWETINSGGAWRGEFRNRTKNGELYWASASVFPITDEEGKITHFIAFQEDITGKKQTEETIKQMAYYDSLTGLPNRQLFNELLHHAMAQAHRHNRLLAVLFLDLDRFKVINDTLGHPVGDQLLQAAAQRLKQCCRRERDTVARRGGDEFIILLPELEDVQDAVRVAQKIIDAFSQLFVLPDHEVFISTCIGISIFPHDGIISETLIKHADMAMYRAKEHGRNRYHLYAPSMDAQAFERLALENSLRKALQQDEFLLYYQPKVNIKTGLIVANEALVRWCHPEFGLVPPTQFIPIAEETGLIVPLGEWVLRTACARNKAWQEAGYPPMRVAVNFSPRQFQQLNLADMVEKVLHETHLEPRWLELEVTENIMLLNEENTIFTLRRLSDLGIHVSIDDFGTGYSSLAHIKRLPIHTLKIDRSFISDINSNQDDEAIATAVITLAKSLKLNVIAEGVETEAQLQLLASLNCAEMQGFLFSKPLSAEDITRLFDTVKRQDQA
ncbi:MAG: response regulator [Geobacteraceae bacterium]|nr:MAG: response regulator [Geobacteraceae bacterium]